MIPFIIFGTRGMSSTVNRGEFFCPNCNGKTQYSHKRGRNWFTLYFIPVIPLNSTGDYIECSRCQGTFTMEVLNYQAPPPGMGMGGGAAPIPQHQLQEMFVMAMKQSMIAMLLADGVVNENQIHQLRAKFQEVSGVGVTEQDLKEEVAHVQQQGSMAIGMLEQLAGQLNEGGKEMVLEAAYKIAIADGSYSSPEQQFMNQIAHALQIDHGSFQAMMGRVQSA